METGKHLTEAQQRGNMASALSLQLSKGFPCPGHHHLISLFPQFFFLHFQTTWKGPGMIGKLVPSACVWVVREIQEQLLNSPLWPDCKSEQLQQHNLGNTQSPLLFPGGCPLLSLYSFKLSDHPPQLMPACVCKLAQKT